MINALNLTPLISTSTYAGNLWGSDTQPVSAVRTKRNVLDAAQLWPNGSTIKIALYDADVETAQAIKDAINEWQPHVNLTFEFVSGEDGDIRIALNHINHIFSSAIGTAAKDVPLHQPTMMLPGDTSYPSFRYVVLHEFGHALGARHAHQHPDSNIPWDKQSTYTDALQRFGWSKETVDENILPSPRNDQHRYQPYDENSVMHYELRSQWTSNDWGQSQSREISDGDIAQMKQAYPMPTPPAPTSPSQGLLRSGPDQPTPPAEHHRRRRAADSDCTTQGAGLSGL